MMFFARFPESRQVEVREALWKHVVEAGGVFSVIDAASDQEWIVRLSNEDAARLPFWTTDDGSVCHFLPVGDHEACVVFSPDWSDAYVIRVLGFDPMDPDHSRGWVELPYEDADEEFFEQEAP